MAIELIHLTSIQITSNYQNIKTEKKMASVMENGMVP